MKPFKLQVVLEHRQRLEDQARQGLANAVQQERQVVVEIAQHTQELAETSRDYEQRQLQGMDAREFILYENQLNHKRQLLIDLEKKLHTTQQQVLASRKALGDASRDKKLLEKLKEKKAIEEKQKLQRLEMAQLDEVAIMFRDEDGK
ncbi:MAG: flagellar export protein FliJ [Desulfuromonas sp.]|nr:flagellar export protein FliJ [Desulfuromonas sp.]